MILWRELSGRGLECFYPQLHVRPANPRSRKVRPYFPGYLFLHTDIEEVGTNTFHWMPFSGGLLAFDGVPATVPPGLVQAIRQHVDEINAAGSDPAAGLKRGEAVEIQGGVFEGHEAIFDARLSGKERVRVLLKLLGNREMNLELPADQIRKKKRDR